MRFSLAVEGRGMIFGNYLHKNDVFRFARYGFACLLRTVCDEDVFLFGGREERRALWKTSLMKMFFSLVDKVCAVLFEKRFEKHRDNGVTQFGGREE